MACRSAASSIISTKARWRPRSGSGRCFEIEAGIMAKAHILKSLMAILIAPFLLAPPARAEQKLIPPALLQAAMKKAECEMTREKPVNDITNDLGNGLKLVEVYCWRAAYNFGSIFFAVDPAHPDKARLLEFQEYTDKHTFRPTYSIVDATFDPKTKVMSTFFKGNGQGICAEVGEWKWDGSAFRMTGYWSKATCHDGLSIENSSDRDEKWRVFPPRK
jgi:Protein of unknown function (DUF1176)